MVTSHAVAVPKASTSTLTPMSSSTVSASAAGSTVRVRCGQMLTPGASDSTMTVATGSNITAASTATNTVHAGDVRCRRRHANSRAMGCDTTAVIFAIISSATARLAVPNQLGQCRRA